MKYNTIQTSIYFALPSIVLHFTALHFFFYFQEEDEVVAMDWNPSGSQRDESPDIFGDSQEVQPSVPQVITSPFSSPGAGAANTTVSSQSDKDLEVAAEAREGFGLEIFKSDSEGEVFHSDDESEPIIQKKPSKQKEEKSLHSVHDIMEADTQIESNSPTSEVPMDDNAKYELKSALRCNIFKFDVNDETVPFYETLLAERPRGKYKQMPFFYDASLPLTKEEHHRAVDAVLTRDSAIQAKTLFTQKLDDYTNKWAPPIRETYEKNNDSLDRIKPNQEPAEWSLLPWGAKPTVLNYLYNAKKSIRETFSMITNRPGLSITKIMSGQSTSSNTAASTSAGSSAVYPASGFLPLPCVKMEKLSPAQLQSVKKETEKVDRPRRETAGVKKEVMGMVELRSDDDDDDDEWKETKPSRGRGGNRGKVYRGRGNNRGGGAGGSNMNQTGGGNRGGKKGKGRGEHDGRPHPPLIGVQQVQSRRRNQSGAAKPLNEAEINEELSHPALKSNTQNVPCPICNHLFHKDDIEVSSRRR